MFSFNGFSKHLLVGLFLLAQQMTAFAAYECRVRVHNLLVYADGTVNVFHTGRNDYTVVCNVNGQYGSVSQIVCASWLSILSQAQRASSTVEFYFPGEGSCSTLPTYGSAPVPSYIGHIKSN